MMLKPLHIIIAAGGTGGHMFPAGALSQELRSRGHRVELITDSRGVQFSGLFNDVNVHLIKSGTFAKNGVGGKVKTLVSLIRGFLRATVLLIKINPEGVIGFGGYPVVPTMMAARFLHIPYGLHEQNAVLGRANRAIVGAAKLIAISFTKTRKLKRRFLTKTYITGNPVRESIIKLGAQSYVQPDESKVFKLLVFGGSQGASVFSKIVPEALGMLPKAARDRLRVIQQARAEDSKEIEATYNKYGIEAKILPFIKDIPTQLDQCHLVISRAGATTIFELAAAGRPAILVPLASAMDDHQSANAAIMAEAGAAWTFTEKEFTSRVLAKHLQQLLVRDNGLMDAARAALALAKPDATKRLADLVEDMASLHYTKLRTKALQQKERHLGTDTLERAIA